MKIAIDATLGKHHIGGMGVYVRTIIKELQKRKSHTYLLFENTSGFSTGGLLHKIFSAVKEHIHYQVTIPKMLKKENADLVYFPNPPIPLLSFTKTILTIPDMSFYYDDSMPFVFKVYLFIMYFLSAHRATIITTFSDYSKKDIVKILKIHPENVYVIPLAALPFFKQITKTDKTKKALERFGISKQYILCTPGTIIPRKNIRDLLLAYKNIREDMRSKLQVVIVANKKSKNYQELEKLTMNLGIRNDVFFLGYIKPNELRIIFNHAKVFVYPSLYEGFGLPPLEAMQCGVPVIVYNRTSLPEIVGKAGLIVNTPKETAAAIEKIVRNPKLTKELIRKGKLQASNYSWEKTADKLEELFIKICS